MKRQQFHYHLPESLIAHVPASERRGSRLLLLDGSIDHLEHRCFSDLVELVRPGDLLVFNDTRVIPARLFGCKATGGKVEVLVERVISRDRVLAHVRASKSPKPNSLLQLDGVGEVVVLGRAGELFELLFKPTASETVVDLLERHGHMPLPPYIERADTSTDRERYQTVYARHPGAVAAPTAGLHFDDTMFDQLRQRGVEFAWVTLHVGAGTFQPVRADNIRDHHMHSEWLSVSAEVCRQVAETRARGGRVVAVGTTSVRCLETMAAHRPRLSSLNAADSSSLSGGESCAGPDLVRAEDRAPTSPAGSTSTSSSGGTSTNSSGGVSADPPEGDPLRFEPYEGETDIFIYPGYEFRVVDALITNFHLPESTLLMLVSAFAGYRQVMAAYKVAVAEQYRFFSYGDAMFLIRNPDAPADARLLEGNT